MVNARTYRTGTLYRAVLIFYTSGGTPYTHVRGPYNTVGPAKTQVTRWRAGANPSTRVGYVQQSDPEWVPIKESNR